MTSQSSDIEMLSSLGGRPTACGFDQTSNLIIGRDKFVKNNKKKGDFSVNINICVMNIT